MTTTEDVTLDQVLTFAQRLAPADQVRLIARLAPQLERLVDSKPTSSARALLDQRGGWAGDDLSERLAEVYAARQPLGSRWSSWTQTI